MDRLVNNYASYLNAQLSYLKNRPKEEKLLINPFITISRETGAYGVTISKALSEYLNKKQKNAYCPWTVFNRSIIKNIFESHHLSETLLPYLNDSAVSEIQDSMEELFPKNSSQHLNVQGASKTILHLAQLGSAIIVGSASNIITSRLRGGIHIRLISPFENRVEHIQEYYPMSEKEAREYIFAEEGNRKDYVKKYFGKDIEDPSLYNMVFNVDVLEPMDIVEIVGSFLLRHFHLK